MNFRRGCRVCSDTRHPPAGPRARRPPPMPASPKRETPFLGETMAKDVFTRTKPHVNVGTIGHIDHGKTTLTAAISARQAHRFGGAAESYEHIARGGTVRTRDKIVTIIASHIQYETAT